MLNRILEKITARHEYALDVRTIDTNRFLHQIDCFHSLDAARMYANAHPCTNKNERYSIICIQYDVEDNEIGTYEIET